MATFSGPRLRTAREAAGLKREPVAIAIGRGVDTVRAYEAGRVDPPASIVGKLAELLCVPPGDLFESAA